MDRDLVEYIAEYIRESIVVRHDIEIPLDDLEDKLETLILEYTR